MNAQNALAGAHISEGLAKRIPAIRAHFARRRVLKNADYREMFGLTRDTAFREMKSLAEEGWLRMEGERRGAGYLPGPCVVSTSEG